MLGCFKPVGLNRIPGSVSRISVVVIFCYLGLSKMCTGV